MSEEQLNYKLPVEVQTFAESAPNTWSGGSVCVDKINLTNEAEFMKVVNARTADVLRNIEAMQFIKMVTNGALPKENFETYLLQDNIYLKAYRDCFIKAAEVDVRNANFFQTKVIDSINQEVAIHDEYFKDREKQVPSKTTAEYIDHLRAAMQSNSYPILIAALLPCCYVYLQIGWKMQVKVNEDANAHDNPYLKWIETYSDQCFQENTDQMVKIAEDLYRHSNEKTKEAMVEAYRISAVLEYDFFEQSAAVDVPNKCAASAYKK
jgi:thiaminase